MQAASTARSAGRHTLVLIAEVLLILAISVTIAFGAALATGEGPEADPALAGRGGTISVPDGTFGGTTTATVNPGGDVLALAKCHQNGELVYMQYVQVNADNQATFKLGPTMLWTSGAANCTAEEGAFGRNGRWRAVASTTFKVSG